MELSYTSTYYRDLTSILDHFDAIGADATAIRFLDGLKETVQSILDFPDLGSPWEGAKRPNVRYRLVKHFENYVVVYRRTEVIRLLRVSHGSQDIGAGL